MALATESASIVARRLQMHPAMGPDTRLLFAAFMKSWAANHGNGDLQLVPYTGVNADDSTGEDLGIDAAHRVYAFWGKKTATAEDVYLYCFDDATDDAGAGTDGRCNIVLLESANEAVALYPSGIPMSAGLVVKAYTDFDGTTDSTAGAVGNGFVLIGLP